MCSGRFVSPDLARLIFPLGLRSASTSPVTCLVAIRNRMGYNPSHVQGGYRMSSWGIVTGLVEPA
jgi:hypothetical protein